MFKLSTAVVAASAAVVAARNSVECSGTGTQLSMLATLKALDDANDVTQDMQTAICSSVVKQAAMSANLDEDEITCKQDVAGVPVKVLTVIDLPGKADATILKDNMEAFVPFELENDPLLVEAGVSDIAATVRSTRGVCTFSENRRLAEAPGEAPPAVDENGDEITQWYVGPGHPNDGNEGNEGNEGADELIGTVDENGDEITKWYVGPNHPNDGNEGNEGNEGNDGPAVGSVDANGDVVTKWYVGPGHPNDGNEGNEGNEGRKL